MSYEIVAKFFDGKVAQAIPVKVKLYHKDQIIIEDFEGNLTLNWNLNDIIVLEKAVEKKPGRLTIKNEPDARLVIKAGRDWLAIQKGLEKATHHTSKLPVSWKSFVGYAALSIAATIFIFIYVPQLLAGSVALIPKSLDRAIGNWAVNSIKIEGECTFPDGVAALDKLVNRVVPSQEYEYQVSVVRSKDVLNALALPGGYVIIYSGIITKARSPEEVAGVLAHEFAHVELRHSTRSILRDLGFSMIIQMMFGSANVVELASFMNRLSYSRDDEAQADLEGVKYLAAAGVDPYGMAAFFELALSEREEISGNVESINVFKYFSTHPETSKRIKTLKSIKKEKPVYEPVLSSEEWSSLKKICAVKDQ